MHFVVFSEIAGIGTTPNIMSPKRSILHSNNVIEAGIKYFRACDDGETV
jgi:hypothetical protein